MSDTIEKYLETKDSNFLDGKIGKMFCYNPVANNLIRMMEDHRLTPIECYKLLSVFLFEENREFLKEKYNKKCNKEVCTCHI